MARIESNGLKYFLRKVLSLGSKDSVLRHMWTNNLPCYDTVPHGENRRRAHLLKYCSWKGKKLPCHLLFVTVATDYGMCCAFNAEKAEKAYKESEYLDIIRRLRESDFEIAQTYFNNETEVVDVRETDFFSTQPGIEKGLTLVLDAESDLLEPSTVSTEYEGFMGYVSPKLEYPWIKSRGFLIEPGKETFVRLKATKVSASVDEIGHIKQEARNCYFSQDKELKIHRRYTMANCIYECSVEHATQHINEVYNSSCIPWYFIPIDENVAFCDPWKAKDFLGFMKNMDPRKDCRHCLPDCETTTYEASHSSSSFR